jgi:hypothetical protein
LSKTEYKKSRWTVYLNSTQAGKLSVDLSHAGVYILENTPPPLGGGKYRPMSFGGENMKRRREKRGKFKRKKKKEERKRKKGERK